VLNALLAAVLIYGSKAEPIKLNNNMEFKAVNYAYAVRSYLILAYAHSAPSRHLLNCLACRLRQYRIKTSANRYL
jgi:hypothetical protein